METQEILNKKVGTIDKPKLEAKTVKIASVEIQKKNSKGDEMPTPLALFKCKHPDKEELIQLSKVKLNRDDKLVISGLWVQVDKDDNIQKGSAVAELLNFLNCESVTDTFGKDIETVAESDKSSFLCLKAY